MQLQPEVTRQALTRLRRVHGQVAGVIKMLEEGRECREVIQQIAAAAKALDRAGFQLLASQLQHCLQDPGAARREGYTPDEMERLFMTLA